MKEIELNGCKIQYNEEEYAKALESGGELSVWLIPPPAPQKVVFPPEVIKMIAVLGETKKDDGLCWKSRIPFPKNKLAIPCEIGELAGIKTCGECYCWRAENG